MKNKFLNAVDEVAPMVSFRRRKNIRCPWMTPELLHLMHKQKSLFRKIRCSPIPKGDLKRQHRRLRSCTTTQYRHLRKLYFRQHLNEYRNALKLLWSAINHVTGRHSQRLPPSAELSTLTDHFKNIFLSLWSSMCVTVRSQQEIVLSTVYFSICR